ncbi:MAG: glycosyltransferase family 87 protein [Candidatus Binatia bacterium]
MLPSPATSLPRLLARLAAFAAVTVLLVALASRGIAPERVCPDFIQFWTAASLLAEGRDPYDPALQALVQQGLGWDKARDGFGIYEFLPYYYPPWLALAVVPLLPLGYCLAKFAWLVLGAEMLLAAGWLLKDTVRGIPGPLALTVVALFGFSIRSVAMGQVAPLVLLLIASAWWLLEKRRDFAAGCVLALLTIKPQLTLLLILAILGWMARQRRWGVWRGAAAATVLLVVASTAAFPGWLPSMLEATRVTPMPTAYYPGLGTTWYVTLGALGLSGPLLIVAYMSVAVPLIVALVRAVAREQRCLEDIIGLALIAPFFVVPYARPYDYPVLLVPALTLMGSRLAGLPRAMLAGTLLLLPSLHILRLAADYATPVVGVRRPEFTYFWIPLLIGLLWLYCPADGSREEGSAALRNDH